MVLRADARGVLRLGDVATVDMNHVPQWVRTTADGHDAVLLQVYQQPDGNSVQIARGVKQRLADYERQAPQGLHIANWYDQTQLVLGAASSVRDAILIGIVLAGLVLFVFLRKVRAILVGSHSRTARIKPPGAANPRAYADTGPRPARSPHPRGCPMPGGCG